jgi:hypothetical protein
VHFPPEFAGLWTSPRRQQPAVRLEGPLCSPIGGVLAFALVVDSVKTLGVIGGRQPGCLQQPEALLGHWRASADFVEERLERLKVRVVV